MRVQEMIRPGRHGARPEPVSTVETPAARSVCLTTEPSIGYITVF
jgi:hypothetical protein